jgi:hypothetical protein
MSRPRTQRGYIFEANSAWHIRYYVHEDGTRKQRSEKLCNKDSEHPLKDSHSVQLLAANFIRSINAANAENDTTPSHRCPVCKQRCRRTIKGTFARKEVKQ